MVAAVVQMVEMMLVAVLFLCTGVALVAAMAVLAQADVWAGVIFGMALFAFAASLVAIVQGSRSRV